MEYVFDGDVVYWTRFSEFAPQRQ